MNPESSQPIVRRREEHTVSRRDIDPDALKVLYRLSGQGHVAYLVGGGVRDLLLGLHPKDFDIGTDAHPNEIKRLFRNCFLIGRRFRLAHIRFGDKVIETSTFRSEPEGGAIPDEARGADVQAVDATAADVPPALLHHRDNTFGTPEEDAHRRDFTVNGLFYDIRTFSVIDHVGGLADLERRVIRSIGDPNIRFCEDPVRMLRAVRFAARLQFQIEPATYEAILRHHAEIAKASAPRLFEEICRLFTYRSGQAAFRLMRETGLLAALFPELDEYLNRTDEPHPLLWPHLAALDTGVSEPILKDPTLALKFSSLFCAFLSWRARAARRDGRGAVTPDLAYETLRPVAVRFQMPKHVFFTTIRILAGQRRFDAPPSAGAVTREPHDPQEPYGAPVAPESDGPGPARPSRRRRFRPRRWVEQDAFPAALALYAIHVAAGAGRPESLRAWRDLYERSRGTQRPPAPRHPAQRGRGADGHRAPHTRAGERPPELPC